MSPHSSLEMEDEQYVSSEDSDFAPDNAPEALSDQSDSEEAAADGPKKRSRPQGDAEVQDEGYNNSGDEAIIARGNKKRKRAQEKGRAVDDDDEGGEGGLVKTRAQRAAEKEERKYDSNHGPVTIDVDAVWAQMLSGEQTKPNEGSEPTLEERNGEDASLSELLKKNHALPSTSTEDETSDTVRIKRTYNFAGRVHTEEKVVARDSAEAKLYLASLEQTGVPTDTSPTKQATRKAFRSSFEPIVDFGPGRTDLNLGLAARIQAGKDARAKKLNTVEKSRMDWAGFVDKEGIKDELELASKSKDSYAARQDFLARSEAIREDDARRARVSGKA